jgi:hypothetical protein
MEKDKNLEEKLGVAQLKVAALTDEVESKEAEIDTLKAENDRLKAQSPTNETAPLPSVPTETCEVDGVEYCLVVASFIANGKSYLSSEVIKNKEAMTELVNMKSGLVRVADA